MKPAPLLDQNERDLICQTLDESLLVEAAAGTGKTTTLVRRLVGILQDGLAAPDQVVAVTFTRKAAGELKLRLREELDRTRLSVNDLRHRANLEEALARMEEAHIGTIHSFCAEILRERPVEAGIDPAFEELAEDEAATFFERVFRPWIETKLEAMPPGLARLMSRSLVRDGSHSFSRLDQIRNAAWRFLEWRDFVKPWQRRHFNRQAEIDAVIARVSELAAASELCRNSSDELFKALAPLRNLSIWVERAEKERPRNYDRLEAFLVQMPQQLRQAGQRKGLGPFAPGITRESVIKLRDDLVERLEEFRRASGADLAVELQSEFRDLVARYDEAKTRSGKLDFVDLLIRTRDLIRDDEKVRSFLQNRFSHLFVDEFQDTDPLQAEILLLLSASDPAQNDWLKAVPRPGKLFLVGDPKQSIYRFRRADVLLYRGIKERLQSQGVRVVRLSQSFRATAPLQCLVNAAFEPEMEEDEISGQPSYLQLEPYREASSDQPSIVVLPVPQPYGKRYIANTAIDASLPKATGAFINWLLHESGWRVVDPEQNDQRVPISARHVAVLFRRFVSWGRDIPREYARQLEIRGIPHVLVGSRSFHEREEVETLRTALAAVEWPDDELSVYATLRGSLFSLPDHLLFSFRETYGRLNPFRSLPEGLAESLLPVSDALQALGRLHRQRNRRPLAWTLTELLQFTRAHASFALRPAGHQVLANVQRVCDLARNFEAAGGNSFRAFVERLEREAKRQTAESPVLEEGVEGVRLMTVHGAKGLEFPVVVLADMTCKQSSNLPDKYVDSASRLAAFSVVGCHPWDLIDHEQTERARDQAEGVRIAYVAATRARDLLVIPAVGDKEREGWLSPLNKAIFPNKPLWRKARRSSGCPEFGDSTVLERPHFYDGLSEFSVKPGEHVPGRGNHKVVWWDPVCLELDVPANFGLRQEEILKKDDQGHTSESGLNDYRSWREGLSLARQVGSKASVEVLTVTESLLTEDPPELIEVQMIPRPTGTHRPTGRRFGTLVHTVLRDVAFDASSEEIQDLVLLHSRMLDAKPVEAPAAFDAVKRTLNQPLLKRAAAADECFREFPVLLEIDEDRVLEGTLDLAFREGDRWSVIDFKTDMDLQPADVRYVRQIRWYGFALRRLTNCEVQGWVLGI